MSFLKKIKFLRTEKGNLYAMSNVLYREYLGGNKLAASYIKGLIKATDENSHS